MRIQIASDLHFEFYPNKKSWKKFIDELVQPVDAIVLAGDICSFKMIPEVLKEFTDRYPAVVYVPGNHEYYGQAFGDVSRFFHYLDIENVHVLRPFNTVIINGQRFIGATLWFPPDPYNQFYARQMNDFSEIKGFASRVYQVSDDHAEYLEREVTSEDIVVTHHLPSHMSVPERYKASQLNRFFVRDLPTPLKAKIWIHGHTHDSQDYMLGDTRIVCNPFGYYDHEVNKKFNPNLVIEI